MSDGAAVLLAFLVVALTGLIMLACVLASRIEELTRKVKDLEEKQQERW